MSYKSDSARKGYSMKEKKTILEFIRSENAYSQIKGRRFWVNLESSGKINRTWQSLKEVFLKRIVPDLHNSYYGLTHEEIKKFSLGSNAGFNDTLEWVRKNEPSSKPPTRLSSRSTVLESAESIQPAKSPEVVETQIDKIEQLDSESDESISEPVPSQVVEQDREALSFLSSQSTVISPSGKKANSNPLSQRNSNSFRVNVDVHQQKQKLNATPDLKLQEQCRDLKDSFIFLDSDDSSDVQELDDNTKNTGKVFGFSSGKPTLNKTSNRVSDSFSANTFTKFKPSTSRILAFSTPSKNPNQTPERSNKAMVESTTDCESEDSSHSDVSYVPMIENGPNEGRGQEMFCSLNGTLLPIYTSKHKKCGQRQKIYTQYHDVCKHKKPKKRKTVYVDDNKNSPTKRTALELNGVASNQKNLEIFNFWKMKYIAEKKRVNEMTRLLSKIKSSSSNKSIIPISSTSDESDEPNIQHNTSKGPKVSTVKNERVAPNTSVVDIPAKDILPPMKDAEVPKINVIALVNSKNLNSSSFIPQANSCMYINTQQVNGIMELLKNLVDPNHSTEKQDSNKANIKDPTVEAKTQKEEIEEIFSSLEKTDKPDKDNVKPTNIREKEKLIFDKILQEDNLENEVNTNRKIFSSNEVNLLLKNDTVIVENGHAPKISYGPNGTPKSQSKRGRPRKNTVSNDGSKPLDDAVSPHSGTTQRTLRSKFNDVPKKDDKKSPIPAPSSTKKKEAQADVKESEEETRYKLNPEYFKSLFENEGKRPVREKSDAKPPHSPLSDPESPRYMFPKFFRGSRFPSRRAEGKSHDMKWLTDEASPALQNGDISKNQYNSTHPSNKTRNSPNIPNYYIAYSDSILEEKENGNMCEYTSQHFSNLLKRCKNDINYAQNNRFDGTISDSELLSQEIPFQSAIFDLFKCVSTTLDKPENNTLNINHILERKEIFFFENDPNQIKPLMEQDLNFDSHKNKNLEGNDKIESYNTVIVDVIGYDSQSEKTSKISFAPTSKKLQTAESLDLCSDEFLSCISQKSSDGNPTLHIEVPAKTSLGKENILDKYSSEESLCAPADLTFNNSVTSLFESPDSSQFNSVNSVPVQTQTQESGLYKEIVLPKDISFVENTSKLGTTREDAENMEKVYQVMSEELDSEEWKNLMTEDESM